MEISKSIVLAYREHPAKAWLQINDPDLLPVIDPETQASLEAGNEFEPYAESLFPDAVRLGFSDSQSYKSLAERTEEALREGARTVFQGQFSHDNLTFICDILNIINVEERIVDLYEIKSSTSVKPEHIVDLAFQVIVLEALNYVVRNIGVLHANKNYVRQGDIQPNSLVVTEDVTERVRDSIDDTKSQIQLALNIVNSPNRPNLSPALASSGGFTEWLEIFKQIKPFDYQSTYSLAGLKPNMVSDFENIGISTIAEIPDDYALSPKQKAQVKANKTGQPIIDKDKINNFIETLNYPIYFLDYETMATLIPDFDGTKPYQQLPFQYSLHILREPGGELEHYEYLHADSSDPTEPLVERLIQDIGTHGSILVWYEGFEKARNRELGELHPKYSSPLSAINERVVDLMLPFSKLWYVDAKFKGSASIKNVLPVLVPDLSYKNLNIQNGGSAQRLWMQHVLHGDNPQVKARTLQDLREYCGLDTLAMFKIFEHLRNL